MRGYMVDIVDIITEEIFKIALSQPTIRRTTRPLSFPCLIMRL